MSIAAMRWPCLFALLTSVWAGASFGQAVPPGEIAVAPEGVDAVRWERVAAQLQDNGYPVESARQCLAPVQEAAQQGLPADTVLAKVEEGAAKGVPGPELQAAARQRLANLQRAASELQGTGYGTRCARHDELMKSVTLALESGLSAETLRDALTRGKGGQSERMRSIVEAGATMRLSGMDETTVGQMMTDFAERNMRRMEVMRASRFAVQQHRASMQGPRVRQQVWDGTGAGGHWGRGESRPAAAGSGSSAGAPAGGGTGRAGSSTSAGPGGALPASSGPADAGSPGSGPGGPGGQSQPDAPTPPGGSPSGDAGRGGSGQAGGDGQESGGPGGQGANAPPEAAKPGRGR